MSLAESLIFALVFAWACVMTVLYVRKNRELLQEIRDLSSAVLTDGLTGLYNARGLEETLRSTISHALRTAEPTTVLFVDLNGFKQVNDTYGHAIGDQLLVRAARVMRTTFVRISDIIARKGGDEFVVVLVGTSAEEGIGAVRRLLQNAANTHVDTPEGRAQLSLSIGSAELFVRGGIAYVGERSWDLVKRRGSGLIDEAVGQLLKDADASMYHAKDLSKKDPTRAKSFAQINGAILS